MFLMQKEKKDGSENKNERAKKVKNLTVIGLVLMMSGCASMDSGNNAKNTKNMIYGHKVVQTDPSKADYQLAYGNDPAVQKAYETYLKTGKAPDIITIGFKEFAYGASQPIIETRPFELTVITLEKGENVLHVNSGDPARWSYVLTYSGSGDSVQAHILLKPSAPALSSNLVIATDKRFYTLKIMSTNAINTGHYLRNVKFWYPDDIKNYWSSYNNNSSFSDLSDLSDFSALPENSNSSGSSNLSNINLKNLNFNYEINKPFWHTPIWTPTKVFDDGVHTYIQFPDKTSTGDLPALFVLNENNQKELVNYRFKKPYFIVDKLFHRAELISDVGSSQTKITIINNQQ